MTSKISPIKNILSIFVFLIIFSPFLSHAFTSFPTKIDTLQERKDIQTVLNQVMVPSPNLKVDGVLGKKSIQAIKDFQYSKGLTPDGKPGPITRNALEIAQQTNTYTSSSSVPAVCSSGALYNYLTGKLCNVTNICTGSTYSSCSITNGQGIKYRYCNNGTWSSYGACTLTSCDTGYSINGNSCIITTTTTPVCTGSTTASCTITNGTGTKSRTCTLGQWSDYGSCTLSSCNTGYSISGNSCVVTSVVTPPISPTISTKIIGVTASAQYSTNTPDKTLDGNMNGEVSAWSAEGNNQYITYELNQLATVSYVRFAFYSTSQRYFDIAYSTNGTTFTNISTGLTSTANMADQFQTFSFNPVVAKYIRFIGHGSSVSGTNGWNAIVEADINGFAIDLTTVTPPATCTPESLSTTCLNKCGTQTNNCGDNVSCTACTTTPPASGDKVIVYFNNYEQNNVGVYTEAERNADWDSCYPNNGESIYQNSSDSNKSKVYRMHFPKGSVSMDPSHGFRCELYPMNPGYEELYVSYKVRFGDGFNSVQGGKLPRLEGKTGEVYEGPGRCPSGKYSFTGGMMFGPDWYPNTFNPFPRFYVYHPDQWKSTQFMETYYDHVGSYPTSCQDFYDHGLEVPGNSFLWTKPAKSCMWYDYNCFLNAGGSVTRMDGAWHTLTQRVVVNSIINGVPQEDGLLEGYFDGEMVIQIKGFKFRTVEDLKINYFDFVTFFGGSGDTWATVKEEDVFYDDLMLFYYTPSSGQPTGKTPSPAGRVLPSMNYPTTSILNNH